MKVPCLFRKCSSKGVARLKLNLLEVIVFCFGEDTSWRHFRIAKKAWRCSEEYYIGFKLIACWRQCTHKVLYTVPVLCVDCPEHKLSTFLWSVGTYQLNYIVAHPRRLHSQCSPMWESHISHTEQAVIPVCPHATLHLAGLPGVLTEVPYLHSL
jgi:hypothetical protein